MKFQEKQLFEFVGILAVVLSLVFVAWELRQANRIAIANSEAEIRTAVRDLNLSVAENPELGLLVAKLIRNDTELSPGEEARRIAYAQARFNIYAQINAAYQNGLLSEYSLDVYRVSLPDILRREPGIVETFADIARMVKFERGSSPLWDTLLTELSERGYVIE